MNTRALFLSGDLSSIGGIEKYNRDFIDALEKAGVEVRNVQRRVGGLGSKVRFILETLLAFLAFRPNYLVCGHLYFSPLALIANTLLGLRYSLSLYGIEAIRIDKSIHKNAICRADRVIFISEYTKQLVIRQFHLDQEKLFMLISSVDEERNFLIPSREKLKGKYGLEGQPVVLTLSRLSSGEEKGQHRVLAAMPEVLKRYPETRYVVAGPGNDDRITKVLSDYPSLKRSLVQIGPVSEEQKLELYNLCDVFILPSKNEGFGIVFIEALACGAQVIASDAYGCREGLQDGQLGALVDPEDSVSISREILNALGRASCIDEKQRISIREKTLKIYGYQAWCNTVKTLAERMVAR
jgi:glycosyltransferase involved in cell wall biosynthesis